MTQRYEVSKGCWKNGSDRLAGHRVAINLQSVKNAIAVKYNKAEYDKMRYACILVWTIQTGEVFKMCVTFMCHYASVILTDTPCWHSH